MNKITPIKFKKIPEPDMMMKNMPAEDLSPTMKFEEIIQSKPSVTLTSSINVVRDAL